MAEKKKKYVPHSERPMFNKIKDLYTRKRIIKINKIRDRYENFKSKNDSNIRFNTWLKNNNIKWTDKDQNTYKYEMDR
jgi:hypothetical protein